MKRNELIWIYLMKWFKKYWGCHQLPERSFFFKTYQFPICARCTGVLIGMFLSIGASCFIKTIPLLICVVLMFPLIIDGIIQYFTKYESTNYKRFITGMFFGFSYTRIVIAICVIIIEYFQIC